MSGEAAGIVNALGRSDDAAFGQLIEPYPDEIQALAGAVRGLVYDVLAQTVEVVWLRQRSVGWGTGPRKFTEQFAYLMPFQRHVTLGFYRGDELADPDGLLPDHGGTQVGGTLSMRSLKLTSVEDGARPALRALLDESTRTGIPPPRD